MEEIKEIILSYCKGIAYPEFELEDLNVMVKEINDHYTKVQSQELSKGRGEVMDKVCTGCGRLESQGSIGGTFLSCCPDRDYQEIGCNMKDLIVFYKSQAKEIEGLRELIENIKVIQTHQLEDFPGSYEGLKTMRKSDELLMSEYSDGYVEVEELRELLKEVK